MMNKDFKEFVQLLAAHDVHYLIVGGYAVAYHGHPRYTKDLDIWIEATAKNAKRLIGALEEFGFGSLGIKKDDFLEPDRFIVLGQEPTRIDLITSVKGLCFEDSYKNRSESEIEGVTVKFVNKHDLIVAKKATGRLQDLADAENLE